MTNSCMFLWNLAPSECASWAQAWGTIAALAVSIGVWWWQSERARWDRVQAEIDRLTERVTPALGLLNGMLQELVNIITLAEAEQGRVFKSRGKSWIPQFQALLDEYLKVEAHVFPDAELALSATRTKELGLRVRELIAAFDMHGPGGGMVMSPTHVSELKAVLESISSCRDEMRMRLVVRANMIITPEPKKRWTVATKGEDC